VIHLYRLILIGEFADLYAQLAEGGRWVSDQWWYTLAHVCQRWRNLVLGSASYLDLCLVCTFGMPVADMLAHSPPLPLIIDYFVPSPPLPRNCPVDDGDISRITAEEKGIIFALKQRDRIRRVRLRVPASNLQKLVEVIDEEYPILEYLILSPLAHDGTTFELPERLQAPHLHHLVLINFAIPIGYRLLTTATSLVTFWLVVRSPSTYFPPNFLLQWISSMPQLETLVIDFLPPELSTVEDDEESQHKEARITLPNLRRFEFTGGNAYLEALVCRFIAPCLEKFKLFFPWRRTFSIPGLVRFMNTTENLTFDSAKFVFTRKLVYVEFYLSAEAETKTNSFFMCIYCGYFESPLPSVAQIFNSLGQRFSMVEHLALEYKSRGRLIDYRDEACAEWRGLLRSFSNVKTLRIDYGLVEAFSRCLRLRDEEQPLWLLPNLQLFTYFGSTNADDVALNSFVDARRIAGSPITLIDATVFQDLRPRSFISQD